MLLNYRKLFVSLQNIAIKYSKPFSNSSVNSMNLNVSLARISCDKFFCIKRHSFILLRVTFITFSRLGIFDYLGKIGNPFPKAALILLCIHEKLIHSAALNILETVFVCKFFFFWCFINAHFSYIILRGF